MTIAERIRYEIRQIRLHGVNPLVGESESCDGLDGLASLLERDDIFTKQHFSQWRDKDERITKLENRVQKLEDDLTDR